MTEKLNIFQIFHADRFAVLAQIVARQIDEHRLAIVWHRNLASAGAHLGENFGERDGSVGHPSVVEVGRFEGCHDRHRPAGASHRNREQPLASRLAERPEVAQHPPVRGAPVSNREDHPIPGLRNGLLTSIAPTGTISLLAGNVSSGIEPIFSLAYDRTILEADGAKRVLRMQDHAIALWRGKKSGASLPPNTVTAADLTPAQHLAMQAAAQAHVDSSISKTINVPADFPFAAFTSVYEEAYAMGLKGCTTFRPNAVTGSILSTPSSEDNACPSCGSLDLVMKEGCTSCQTCGFAFCG